MEMSERERERERREREGGRLQKFVGGVQKNPKNIASGTHEHTHSHCFAFFQRAPTQPRPKLISSPTSPLPAPPAS